MSLPAVNAVVTLRESLRWPPATPLKEVDVLVLAIGKYFLDLRVYHSDHKRIDWSMAGVFLDLPGSREGHSPIRFLNIIDARDLRSSPHAKLPASGLNPEEAECDLATPTQDDTLFVPIPDTATTSLRSLETGNMPNPESKDDISKYVPYEEIWQELGVAPGSPAVLLETVGGDGLGKAYTSRIGNWRLGLMDDGNGTYFAWRDDCVDGKWVEKYSIGEGCREKIVPLEEGQVDWTEGKIIALGRRDWIVRYSGVSA